MTNQSAQKTVKAYEYSGYRFADAENHDYYDRHLIMDHAVSMEKASQRQRFEALARSIRDFLTFDSANSR
jgi:glycogen phosphorylase